MKKHLFIYLICCLGFTSCYDVEKPSKPEPLLSEEKMAHVILDLQIAAAAKGVNKKLLEDNKIIPRDFVFKKHQIDSVLFAKNNNYYAFNLDAYNRIYDIVKDSLSVLKKQAENNSLIKTKNKKDIKNKNIKTLKETNKLIEALNEDKQKNKPRS